MAAASGIDGLPKDLQDMCQQWFKWDKNPKTRSEIEQLIQQNNHKELSKRLSKRIEFGTAGLRGRMQAGFNSMNDLTVIQASQGLCIYLEKNVENFKEKGIVVGYDIRYNSKTFAELTALTFMSRGVKVYRINKIAATPLVPFCVLLKGAAAGVMVTASHNPKDDNGYKVYWSNGSQIISPVDSGVAQEISNNLEPWNLENVGNSASHLLLDPTQDLMHSYFQLIQEQCCYHRDLNQRSQLPIVFTPMHGVGKEWVAGAFQAFGLPPYIPVPEQIEPDPDFPTVPFPNPEEGKGAMQLGMNTGDKNNSRLVIANDPDSDRLAVAEKQSNGQWRMFTGNEVGILLGHWIWTQYRNKHQGVDPRKCVVLNTTVSSKMLKAMADKEGLYYEETLTGFKWLGNKAESLTQKGYTFLYAFEEAIGYMISNICLDKDGLRAAAAVAEMANFYEVNGGILLSQQLERMYQEYGFFATNNRYFFCYDPSTMEKIFAKIRNGGRYCDSVGAYKIRDIRDLTTGYDSTQPTKKAILPTSSSTHMITFFFENGCVATLRGSGTEPKLKYYVELTGNNANQQQVRSTLDDIVENIIKYLLEPDQNGLERPED